MIYFDFMNITHLQDLLYLQETIVKTLDNKYYFISNDEKFFIKVFENSNNICLGVFENKNLIGYAIVLDNVDDYFDYFNKFKITPNKHSYNFDILVVSKTHRNKGLANQLIQKVIDVLIKRQIFEIYCTIHPKNLNSLNCFCKNNFKSIGTIIKHNNYKRLFLINTLKKDN